jgi:hypothetical protein
MPYSDPERERQSAIERKRRYRARKHAEKYGLGAGDQRGKGRKAKGSANHRWNDSRILNEDGYVKVRVGRDHPLADPNGYAYEHLVVWCAAGRPRPGRGQLLHHQNEDKTDNRLSNLELITRAEHGKHHIADRARGADGRLLPKPAGLTHDAFPEVRA